MAAYTYPSYVLSISNTYDTMAEITSPIDELNDLVRNVVVKHNWPLFDDEIVRHLSLRTGQPLPADTELRARLEEEAEAVP